MRHEYSGEGSKLAFAVQIPLRAVGHGTGLTAARMIADDLYRIWQEHTLQHANFVSNWGITGVWTVGVASLARFKPDPIGARGFVHVPGAVEPKDVLVFSGFADMFETDVKKIVERLTSMVEAVAPHVGADLDGPHPIFLNCGDCAYFLYKEEAPVAKSA